MTTAPPQALEEPQYWNIPKDWQGEAAFIVGGGPSVRDVDLGKLRGRNVVAINSSYAAVLWADYLIVSDARWWDEYRQDPLLDQFQGKIVSALLFERPGDIDPRWLLCKRYPGDQLCRFPDALLVGVTTTLTAIDMVAHLGADRIGLLGIDGDDAPDGSTHHHAPHPEKWPRIEGCYVVHGRALKRLIPQLSDMQISVAFATPSAHKMFPRIPLDELLERWE